MGWQNVIIGYKIQGFKKDDLIPSDAKFLGTKQKFVGMYGWVSNPQPNYETIYEYQIPVYKKKNVKTI